MPTLRHKMAALMGAVALLSTVFLGAGVARAQVGYPPGTSVPPACTAGNVNAGNVAVGQTITFTLCGDFTPGATVTVTVDGTTVFAKTPTNGAVTVVATVVSDTVVQVGDPVNAAVGCGTNTVTATGLGTPGISSGTFNLVCTTTTTTNGGLALTGANVMWAVLAALVLIALGTLLVLFQRRRRQTI